MWVGVCLCGRVCGGKGGGLIGWLVWVGCSNSQLKLPVPGAIHAEWLKHNELHSRTEMHSGDMLLAFCIFAFFGKKGN